MSRSNAPLQKTIDRWVNVGALRAYARRLYAQQDTIAGYQWPDEPTGRQKAAIDALSRAQQALELAASLVGFAECLADELAYERIYGPKQPAE